MACIYRCERWKSAYSLTQVKEGAFFLMLISCLTRKVHFCHGVSNDLFSFFSNIFWQVFLISLGYGMTFRLLLLFFMKEGRKGQLGERA